MSTGKIILISILILHIVNFLEKHCQILLSVKCQQNHAIFNTNTFQYKSVSDEHLLWSVIKEKLSNVIAFEFTLGLSTAISATDNKGPCIINKGISRHWIILTFNIEVHVQYTCCVNRAHCIHDILFPKFKLSICPKWNYINWRAIILIFCSIFYANVPQMSLF